MFFCCYALQDKTNTTFNFIMYIDILRYIICLGFHCKVTFSMKLRHRMLLTATSISKSVSMDRSNMVQINTGTHIIPACRQLVLGLQGFSGGAA